MKTAIWIYLFMFVALFDLHAQFPILSPFAISLGATPSFIGLIMGMYSITHVPGNLIAGYAVDRHGSKRFIIISLVGAGLLLLWQATITDPWQLLIIRSISGFILAFLSPACMTLLVSLAKNATQQGHFMSGNGLIHTIAAIVSPAAGAILVAKIGFSNAFVFLGGLLIVVGILAGFFIHDIKTLPKDKNKRATPYQQHVPTIKTDNAEQEIFKSNNLWGFYMLPLALSCSQGILFFELPLMPDQTLMASGILFSIVSLGSLLTLSMLFLNHYSSAVRNVLGGLILAMTYFGMAVNWPGPLEFYLFMIGACKGLLYPALATFLTGVAGRGQYGKVFAFLSVAYSIGAFFGPMLAGYLREFTSPYYIAFLVLMVALMFFPYGRFVTFPLRQQEE